jgi:predicted dehydrogenase
VKLLIIGLGSMGKRRIRCLLALGVVAKNIIGFDTRRDRAEETKQLYSIETHCEFTNIDLSTSNAWIIATPPHLHMHYALIGASLNKHLFIEASVVDTEMDTLQTLLTKHSVVVFPSCTMRFFPGPEKIFSILNSHLLGKTYAWQYQSGQYLADWHPWEKVEDFYVSRKETGGCREIVPFELSWLTKAFGPISNIKAHQDQVSLLAKEIDDIYLLQVQHQNGIFGQLLVDVLSRFPVRYMRITAEKGSLTWDAFANEIRVYTAEKSAWETISLATGTIEKRYINPEEPYQKEIEAFLTCIKQSTQPHYTLDHDRDILKLLYLAEKNAAQTTQI